MATAPRVNYLNNKDMLAAVHNSKSSYCVFTQPEYHRYDAIVHDIAQITEELIETAKRTKAKRLTDELFNARKLAGGKVKLSDCEIQLDTIDTDSLIFRVISYDHIPMSDRKKNPKTVAEHHEKINFIPFLHYKFNNIGELECVGKSHWRGDLDTGHYDRTTGKISDTLARMILKICERFSTRSNIRGYTYVDEMRGHAVLQLTQICLQFDESKSDNVFAYFSATLSNSMIRILNIEKRHQNIRDDILEQHGLNPSFTRTHDGEYDSALSRS